MIKCNKTYTTKDIIEKYTLLIKKYNFANFGKAEERADLNRIDFLNKQ